MELTPLAADSMGVRSFAWAVRTPEQELLLDPGASLGPRRDGYRPHLAEYRALKERSNMILAAGESVDTIIVTHYHFDHYVPSFENWRYNWCSEERARALFSDGTVLAKHTEDQINYSQGKRAYYFEDICEAESETLLYADGETFERGDLVLEFSEPVPHGPSGTDLGWVLMVAIEGPTRTVVYTSDVQGPVVEASRNWILDRDPDLILLDAPPIYLSEDTFSPDARAAAREHMADLAREAPLVVDHHLVRSDSFRSFLDPVREAAEEHGHAVETAASFNNEPERFLERERASHHESDPVPESFYDRVESGYYVENPLPES